MLSEVRRRLSWALIVLSVVLLGAGCGKKQPAAGAPGASAKPGQSAKPGPVALTADGLPDLSDHQRGPIEVARVRPYVVAMLKDFPGEGLRQLDFHMMRRVGAVQGGAPIAYIGSLCRQPPNRWRLDLVASGESATVLSLIVDADAEGVWWRQDTGESAAIPAQSLVEFLRADLAKPEEERLLPQGEYLLALLQPDSLATLEAAYDGEAQGFANVKPRTGERTVRYVLNRDQGVLEFRLDVARLDTPIVYMRGPGSAPGRGENATLDILANTAGVPTNASFFQAPASFKDSGSPAMLADTSKLMGFRPSNKARTSKPATPQEDPEERKRRLAAARAATDEAMAALTATLPKLPPPGTMAPAERLAAISPRGIPAPGGTVQTEASLQARVNAISSRDLEQAYLAHPSPDAPWHGDALELMKRASGILAMRDYVGGEITEAATLGLQVAKQGCDDPLVVATIFRLVARMGARPFAQWPQNQEAYDLIKRYGDAIMQSDRLPHYMKYIVCVGWIRFANDTKEKRESDRVKKYAEAERRAAYMDTSISQADLPLIMRLCSDENAQLYYTPNRGSDYDAALVEAGHHAWYLEMQDGLSKLQHTRFVTGIDAGSYMTDEARTRVVDISQSARASLMAAHAHNPNDPQAATGMIRVAMYTSTLAECRYWFEQAVAAQVDYRPAYDRMFDALEPEWFGERNYALSMAFAEECLSPKLAGTAVPSYYVLEGVHRLYAVSEEADFIFKHPRILAGIKRMCDLYERDGKAIPGFEKEHGLQAYIDFKQGHYDAAAARLTHFDSLNLVQSVSNEDIGNLYREIAINGGELGMHYRAAIDAYSKGDATTGAAQLAIVQQRAPSQDLYMTAKAYAVRAEIDHKLKNAGHLDYPLDTESKMVHVAAGTWRFENGTAIADLKGTEFDPALNLARVPPLPFRIECTIDYPTLPTEDLSAGLRTFVTQNSDRGDGQQGLDFDIARLCANGPALSIGIPVAEPATALVAAPTGRHNRLRADVYPGETYVYVNGVLVIVAVTNRIKPVSTIYVSLTKQGTDAANPARFSKVRTTPLAADTPVPPFLHLTVDRLDRDLLAGRASDAKRTIDRLAAYPNPDIQTLAKNRALALANMALASQPSVDVAAAFPSLDTLLVTSGTWTRGSAGQLSLATGDDITGMLAVPVGLTQGSLRVSVPRATTGSFGLTLGNTLCDQQVVATVSFDPPFVALRSSDGPVTSEKPLQLPTDPTADVELVLTAVGDQVSLSIGGRQVLQTKRVREKRMNNGTDIITLESLKYFGLWARPGKTPTLFKSLELRPTKP